MILREQAASVVGVDNDQAAVDAARLAAEEAGAEVSFQLGDAMRLLDEDLAERYDALVCFEGLEHLPDFPRAMAAVKRHAERGLRVLVSVPNSRTFQEDNEFHVTNLDHEAAMAAFGELPGRRVLFQYTAEGAVILDEEEAAGGTAQLLVPDRAEPEYANTYLCAVNVPAGDLAAAAGHMRFTLAPHQTRELRNLARANHELWLTNRQLGRQLSEIGKQLDQGGAPLSALRSFDTAAGSALNKLIARAELAEQELAAARVQLAGSDDAAIAWGRYHELRNRRAVKLVLRLSRLVRR
jgi:hypothetical protein